MPKISIIYITSRIDPKVEWFCDSLAMLTTPDEKHDLEIIFVDRLVDGVSFPAPRYDHFKEAVGDRFAYSHIPPKPSPWQGSHRVTKEDWFAASNARNTGIINASGDNVVFVDDLSVLTGEWFKSVKEWIGSGKVQCGAYRKVKDLTVENGNITHFTNYPGGLDNRAPYAPADKPMDCAGNWLYGCSFASPIQFLLDVNGSDEACDGMGFEDCILGIRLANRKIAFQYDPRMCSYESEEAHHVDKVMKRIDKGVSPNDKSHAILAKAQSTDRAENAHFGPGGIAAVRDYVLKNGTYPEMPLMTHDWYDGQLIADFV